MTVEELVKQDHQFNESTFLSKANNRIKNLYQSITLKQMERLQAFVSLEYYQRLKEKIDGYWNQQLNVVYDEIRVDSELRSIEIVGDYYVIVVQAEVQYLKYFTSMETGKVMYGDPDHRVKVIHKAFFKKRIGDTPEHYRCFGCGTSLVVENSGRCPNCGRFYDLGSFEYLLDNFI